MKETSDSFDDALDKIEVFVAKISDWTIVHRNLVVGISGGLILFYGGFFGNTLLLLQTIGNTDGKIISDSLSKLAVDYKLTRKAIREQMPELLKAKDTLVEMFAQERDTISRIVDLERRYASKSISVDEFSSSMSSLKDELKNLQVHIAKIRACSSAFSSIYAAANVPELQVYVN